MNPQLYPVAPGHGVACLRADPGMAAPAPGAMTAEAAHV
jgi:hypothetical protein